ncbi:hypothetical protein BH11BAC1_BH11BAC1_15330 [soil metagenome]
MNKYLRVLFVLITILFFSQMARPQSWQWAAKAGGNYIDYSTGVAVDDSGNSYITGKFFDAASFGSSTLVSPGLWSVYIAKYDDAGNLLWAKIAARDSLISGSGISVDDFGGILITGQYYGQALFGISGAVILNSSGDYDVYVAKYNSSGDLLWAQSFGGPGIDFAGGISTDYSGNVFLTGDLHATPFPYSSSKIFLSKYDPAGNNLWYKKSLKNGTDHFGNGIKTDAAGDIYITGEFFDTLLFDSSVIIAAGNVESNCFLARFDSSGNILWGQKAGAPSGYCGSKAIDIDAAGNSYITGYFHGTISLGSFSITGSSGLANEVFIAKCDPNGSYVWVGRSTGQGNSRSISIDTAGNAFICGYFAQSITFGSDSINTSGGFDIFITKLNTSGNFEWTESCGGAQQDYAQGIKVTPHGIFLSGYFEDTIYFGTPISLTASSANASDIFLAKLNNTTGLEEKYNSNENYFCFPNPVTTELNIANIKGNEKFLIYNAFGSIVMAGNLHDHKINVNKLCSGIYFISVYTKNSSGELTKVRFIISHPGN